MTKPICPLRYTARVCNEPVRRDVLGAAAVAVAEEEEKTRRPGVKVTLIRPGQGRGNMFWWGETEHEAVEAMLTAVAGILIEMPEARANWPDTRKREPQLICIEEPSQN